MGKFNEYTQKATPADNDTMMIYDAVTKTNKLSPFSGIWNWIVGKLTNAVISNLQTNNQTMIGAINELKSNTHLGTLNDNIAEYLSKTNGTATTYFVWGNIGGLYPSWAWGTLLCSNDNTANFIGIANSEKTAAFAHYENGAWEKVPVELLQNLTTTNKSSLVGAINELNSNKAVPGKIPEFFGNIDKINNTSIVAATNQSSGTLPKKIGGNRYVIITDAGFDESRLIYAVQFAVGFGSSTIAIRNCSFTTTGNGKYSEWRYI